MRRRFGADLCYSPMINCNSLHLALTAKSRKKGIRERVQEWFNVETGEEGHGEDQKLIVQVAGHDPQVVLEVAEHLQSHCLAIDLNLGCPQTIAKRGHYGSFLQEDWPLIFNIINTLHLNLRVPVTAKMRVFPDVETTVAYARMLEHAGAQIITVHGRTREQKGHKTGIADWQKVKAVKEAVSVPVFVNGNVLYHEDLERALSLTGADGVMSAEGNLSVPNIFATPSVLASLPVEMFPHRADGPMPNAAWAEFPYSPAMANAYLDQVVRCNAKTEAAAIKGHIFRLCHASLPRHVEIRNMIGKARSDFSVGDKAVAEAGVSAEQGRERSIQEYREAVRLLDEKLMVRLHISVLPASVSSYQY